jgi:hypothetical protein
MKKSKPAKLRPINQIVPVKADEPESCGRCYYWRFERCMRYPPNKIPGQPIATQRPVTAKTDWCGEFRPEAR